MQAFRLPLDESAATDLRFHRVTIKMLAPIQGTNAISSGTRRGSDRTHQSNEPEPERLGRRRVAEQTSSRDFSTSPLASLEMTNGL